MRLLEIITAVSTKEGIKGCKEGSLVWLHEKGHQLQNSERDKLRDELLSAWFFPLAATSLYLITPLPFSVLWGIWLMVYLSREFKAWRYAFKHRKKEAKK